MSNNNRTFLRQIPGLMPCVNWFDYSSIKNSCSNINIGASVKSCLTATLIKG